MLHLLRRVNRTVQRLLLLLLRSLVSIWQQGAGTVLFIARGYRRRKIPSYEIFNNNNMIVMR